jgi:hypothetical protein
MNPERGFLLLPPLFLAAVCSQVRKRKRKRVSEKTKIDRNDKIRLIR